MLSAGCQPSEKKNDCIGRLSSHQAQRPRDLTPHPIDPPRTLFTDDPSAEPSIAPRTLRKLLARRAAPRHHPATADRAPLFAHAESNSLDLYTAGPSTPPRYRDRSISLNRDQLFARAREIAIIIKQNCTCIQFKFRTRVRGGSRNVSASSLPLRGVFRAPGVQSGPEGRGARSTAQADGARMERPRVPSTHG